MRSLRVAIQRASRIGTLKKRVAILGGLVILVFAPIGLVSPLAFAAAVLLATISVSFLFLASVFFELGHLSGKESAGALAYRQQDSISRVESGENKLLGHAELAATHGLHLISQSRSGSEVQRYLKSYRSGFHSSSQIGLQRALEDIAAYPENSTVRKRVLHDLAKLHHAEGDHLAILDLLKKNQSDIHLGGIALSSFAILCITDTNVNPSELFEDADLFSALNEVTKAAEKGDIQSLQILYNLDKAGLQLGVNLENIVRETLTSNSGKSLNLVNPIFSLVDSRERQTSWFKESYLLSIVVPAHRLDHRLERCVQSVLSQRDDSVELLVVLDGSDDMEQEKVSEMESRFHEYGNHFEIVKQKNNLGAYSARQLGLTQAKGKFIKILDSDEWIADGAISEILGKIMENASASAIEVGGIARFSEETGLFIGGPSSFYVPSPTFSQPNNYVYSVADLLQIGGWMDDARVSTDTMLLRQLKISQHTALRLVNLDKKDRKILFYSGTSKDDNLTTATATNLLYAGSHPQSARFVFESSWEATLSEAMENGAPPLVPTEQMRKKVYVPGIIRQIPIKNLQANVAVFVPMNLGGGTLQDLRKLVSAMTSKGLSVILINSPLSPAKFRDDLIHPQYFKILKEHGIEMAVLGQHVQAEICIFLHPYSVQNDRELAVEITCKKIVFIVNQAPFKDSLRGLAPAYSVAEALLTLMSLSKRIDIFPVGPFIESELRESLHGKTEVARIQSWRDAYATVPESDFKENPIGSLPSEKMIGNQKIKVGSVQRDSIEKWPSSKEVMKSFFDFDKDTISYQIVGGTESLKSKIGRSFQDKYTDLGYIESRIELTNFLSSLDFFLFFPRENVIDAFPSGICEALSAGVPVITYGKYKSLFEGGIIASSPKKWHTDALQIYSDKLKFLDLKKQARDEFFRLQNSLGYAGFIERVWADKDL